MDSNTAIEPGEIQPHTDLPEEPPGVPLDVLRLDEKPTTSAVEQYALQLPAGTSKVHLQLEVPEGALLSVELEARTSAGKTLGRKSLVFGGRKLRTAYHRLPLILSSQGLLSSVSLSSLSIWFTWLSLGVYALVRLIDLPAFPIYFFTDEAVQTVLAADFLRDGLRSPTGEFLPTFFQNGSQYNLGTSVYLQVLPYLVLGKSIWVTRGASVLMTLIAAASVGLILKRIFKSPYPWLAILFLSITPAWFLHSRTAFETALATTFYAAFLYFYLVYRKQEPRRLYIAIVFAALTFYSYSPMRVVIAVTALLLFFSDPGYHWKNRAVVWRGLALVLLLALPFARFLIFHPQASVWQMRLLGSYWIYDISLVEKLDLYVGEYLHGLSLIYWYLPGITDLPRHTMDGYGHLLRPTLPLGLMGIGLALWKIRQPEYRVLLIAVLAAPAGAAVVRLGITRALVMVIPMAVLTALAASTILDWLRLKKKVSPILTSSLVFLLLIGANLFMLNDALRNAPLWNRSYGLSGMQYGAQQLFTAVQEVLDEKPDTQMVISPSWANGTDVTARFFFNDPLPFHLGSAIGYYKEVRNLTENHLFVMIPEEYNQIPANRFSEVNVEKILPYPDGRPGFYFVRLKYVEDIESVIAKEEETRRQLDTRQILIGGEMVRLSHSRLDLGSIENLFDGSRDTLVRTWAVNPMQLDFSFARQRQLSGVDLRIGGTAATITLWLWSEGEELPFEITHKLEEAPLPREIPIDFWGEKMVVRMLINVLNTNDPDDGHVHLWEVRFK
jgi:hypothetical protein